MGEDVTDMATTTSALQAKLLALTGGQVDIMLDANTFKNSTQILREMAEAWEDMDDISRASALELMGGKRQANVLSALISNFDTVEKVIETSANSAGSALKENERYLNSIQGKIDQFNNAVQSMWNNTLNSDWVKGIVDAGTEIINLVDDVGALNLALTGLFMYISTKYMNMNWAHPIKSFKEMFGKPAAEDINLVKNNLKQLEIEYESAKHAFAMDPSKSNKENLDNIGNRLKEYKAINSETIGFQDNLTNAQSELAKAQSRLDNYTGKNANTIKKYQGDVKRAQANVDALNQSQQRAAQTGATGWQKLGVKMDGFAKKVQSAIASMLVMYAISNVMSLVGELWDKANETAEEAKESFEELSSELSKTESELSTLESQLKDIKSQIEDINKNTPLTFTEQEELNRLQAQSDELQRQIDLTTALKEQQQYKVNESAINAADKYAQTGVKTGKTTGENVGEKAGTGALVGAGVGVASGVGTAILGAKAGTKLGSWAGPIGMLIGAAIGAIAGAAIGAAVGGIESASEEKVGESLENMKKQYQKLQSEFDVARANYTKDASDDNKKKFEDAQEALRSYQSNMANYISEMDIYYGQIKQNWAVATEEQKKEYIKWADQMDAWAIQTGGQNAKTNAIARIVGDEASDELKEVKQRLEEAAQAGKELNLQEAFDGNTRAYTDLKNRLYELGLTVYEVELYFKNQQKAAEEAISSIETYDAIKQIQQLTSGVNDLKNAFKELHEEGIVSADTLLGLEKTFGDVEGWNAFFEVMSTGTSTMQEAEEAAKNLAETYIDDLISSGKYSADQYITYISHLQSLGIRNAREFIDAKLKKSMATDIASRVKNGEDQNAVIEAVEEEYGIKLDGESDRLLIEKAITAEKAKQAEIEKRSARKEYVSAVDKRETIKSKIENLSTDQFLEEYGEEYGIKTSKKDGAKGKGRKTIYEYNGTTYRSIGSIRDAIIQEELKKQGVAELPIEVTEIDVTNAESAAKNAESELQAELDKHGLELKIDLVGFDETVDKVQDVYSTLKNIATEYNTQGYLSLDNLQALLQLTPEYLAVLQMENGQITINQQALEGMLQTKLAEAEATAVQTAITQLSALAERKQAIEISNSAVAANQASIELGTYSNMLGTVAQDAIIAAGSVTAFNNALRGAQDNAFVSDDEINQILSNFNNSVDLINSVRENLPSSFNSILDPGSQTAPEEVADDRFQKAMDYWENRLVANQAKSEQIQNEIDLLESKGQKADASFYDELIKLANERKWLLEQQRAEAQALLSEFEEGSEEWWEVANALNDIEGELDDVVASIVDFQDAMGEIDTYKFEELNNRLDDLTRKLETIRNLIAPNGEEDWFDDDGNWTESGVAVLGSHIQELETYKQGYQNTMDELAKYQPNYEGNKAYYETLGVHSEQEYYDKVEELTDQQYQFAESVSDTEQFIVDMYESSIDAVENYVDTLIDGYNDYIDTVKEALDAERDLYDFKKNVQKQAKDIAEIERRIMSLSGSTNAADIAERRRLEADLYGAREELDNTYYDHAKESQQNALDAEAEAYEENMTKFVEGLRISLEEATVHMDEFLMGVATMVMYNADTILAKYEETNLPLAKELTNPWEEAKKATSSYSGNAIDLMNQWTKQGGFFSQFNTSGTTNLSSPWSAGTNAANSFKTSVSTVMSGVVSNIQSNVKTARESLANLTSVITETENKAANANVAVNSGGTGNSGGYVAPQKKYYVTAFLDMGGRSLSVTKSDIDASKAMSAAKIAILGEYEKVKGNNISAESAWQRTWKNKVKYTTQYYAKGTMGTKRDEWAITDELGPELKMYATPEGNLSFMAVGSTVIPKDLTKDIINLPDIVDGLINMPKFDSGVNIITNAVNKPEINLSFEALVKAERIDEGTLPEVKRFVQQEINTLVKQMNYAIKGKGGR